METTSCSRTFSSSLIPSNSTGPTFIYTRKFRNINCISWKTLGSCAPLRLKHKKLVVANGITKGIASDGGGTNNKIKKKLAVFVSGGGSNFKSIHEAILQDLIHADVAVVVTDKPGCGGSHYASGMGIPVLVSPRSASLTNGLSAVDLVASLRKLKIDFILLAGYLKLLPVELVRAYPKSILNIHPSLLPAFGGKGYYGSKVHKAVIASGARYSGPTIHFVDEHYDTGRILAQKAVPVFMNDTAEELAARVLHEEHILYVEAVAALCEDRVVWREDGVPFIRKRGSASEYY